MRAAICHAYAFYHWLLDTAKKDIILLEEMAQCEYTAGKREEEPDTFLEEAKEVLREQWYHIKRKRLQLVKLKTISES